MNPALLFEAAAELSHTATCITTADLRLPGPTIIYCNQAYADLLGAERDSLIGQTPRIMQGPLTQRRELDRLRRELAMGESSGGETINYRLDGTPFLVHWWVEPVLVEGRCAGFVAWQRDVTEQRRNEAALRATAAVDTALQDALRRPGSTEADFRRLVEVSATALRRLVGIAGTVELSVTARELHWPARVAAPTPEPTPSGEPTPTEPSNSAPPTSTVELRSPRGRFAGVVTIGAIDAAHLAFVEGSGLARVCLRVSSALDALLELSELRTIALRLQESLLPPALVSGKRFRVVSRYLPCAVSALIGGDWYDVVHRPDDVVFVIGDVMGHDMSAAASMGRVRTAVSLLIRQGRGIDEVLVEADRFCLEEGVLATCLLVRYDGTVLEMASAGHPPPILSDRDGTVLVDLEPGPPLGVGAPRPQATACPLADDGVLVLFTDGLVEVRGEDIAIGLEVLRDATHHNRRLPLSDLADALVLTRRDPDHLDDLAVLAVAFHDAED